MILDRREIEAGAAWARKALGKDAAHPTVERKGTEAERIAAWLAEGREAEDQKASATQSDVQATRRDLATPGASYAVGSDRYAADGSLWRRVG